MGEGYDFILHGAPAVILACTGVDNDGTSGMLTRGSGRIVGHSEVYDLALSLTSAITLRALAATADAPGAFVLVVAF